MSTAKRKVWLPILVLLLSAGVLGALLLTKPTTQKSRQPPPATLVDIQVLQRKMQRFDVHAQGEVIPARRVHLHAQVSGRVTDVAPNLAPGGVIDKGERIVQIDPLDYELAVEQRKTQLAEARAQLELEQGRNKVAEQEYALFEKHFEEPVKDRQLALREPQLAAIRAQVKRAQAALAQAQLQLQRTSIESPFRALVVNETVDVGQLAQPQQAIAELVDATEFWVRIYLPPEKLNAIAIPGVSAKEGSTVHVSLDLGGQEHIYKGRILRVEGQLQQRTRLAAVIAKVEDPIGQLGNSGHDFPMFLHAFVSTTIEGRERRAAIAVPRAAIHNDNQVYLFRDGKLAIETLQPVWQNRDFVFVQKGVEPQEQVIVSSLEAPIAGMRLKRSESSPVEASTQANTAQLGHHE